jgi:hypothetical protein
VELSVKEYTADAPTRQLGATVNPALTTQFSFDVVKVKDESVSTPEAVIGLVEDTSKPLTEELGLREYVTRVWSKVTVKGKEMSLPETVQKVPPDVGSLVGSLVGSSMPHVPKPKQQHSHQQSEPSLLAS